MRFADGAKPMTLLFHAAPQDHLHSEPLMALLVFAAMAAVFVYRRQRL
jgi:hypothetical protein